MGNLMIGAQGEFADGWLPISAALLPKIKPKQRGKVVIDMLPTRQIEQTGSEMNAAKISLF